MFENKRDRFLECGKWAIAVSGVRWRSLFRMRRGCAIAFLGCGNAISFENKRGRGDRFWDVGVRSLFLGM